MILTWQRCNDTQLPQIVYTINLLVVTIILIYTFIVTIIFEFCLTTWLFNAGKFHPDPIWNLMSSQRHIWPNDCQLVANSGRRSPSSTSKHKKLSYRRETARQLPTWRGLGPPAHSPSAASGYTYMRMVESESHNVRTSSVPSTKRTLRWIAHSRSFKVILIGAGRHPERCVVLMCT